ncbi:MAG: hypothetical protein JNN15_12910 [Blastocatellia bacterium]|nr:hypothetical protein [Blastocatellia bacterium]
MLRGDSQKVSVGIIDAHHHTPEFTVYKLIAKKDGREGKEARETREIARFTENQLKRTLTVSVSSRTSTTSKVVNKRLGKYISLSGRESDSKDFGWTLDIENDLYGRKLKIKEDAFLGKIHFKSGVFYTNRLSEEKYRFVATDGSGKTLPFFRQVGRPAAKIDLENSQEVVIAGFAQSLKLKAESGVDYLVTVHNLPPPDLADLSHFLMYYDVIDEELTQYEPVMVKSTGTLEHLCAPRAFGSSPLN